MKTLVIVAHPNLDQSRINKCWVQELEKHDQITVHKLYDEYPNFAIDVEREQELLLEHDRIVLQFPLYWYSSPALLKKWQDEVLTYGFAYGSQGTKLHGKQLGLAISIGGPQDSYQAGGFNHYTISELTKPFQATSNFAGTKFLPTFTLYGANQVSDEDLEQSAKDYAAYVLKE